MLNLNLSPIRSDEPKLAAEWVHPILTVDGMVYDLSELPDGATAHHPVLGRISRSGNDYEVTLRLSHGPNAPEETRFPQPITVTEDGPIHLPPYDAPEPEPAPEDPTNDLA